MENYEKIAAVTHAALKAWGELHGDFSMPEWNEVESLYKAQMIDEVISRVTTPKTPFNPPGLPWVKIGRYYTRKYLPIGRVCQVDQDVYRMYTEGIDKIFCSTVLATCNSLNWLLDDDVVDEYNAYDD